MFLKNTKKLFLIHVLTPLFIGGLLYTLFRTTTLRMFKWFSIIGIDDFICLLRRLTLGYKNYIPKWSYFSLPDGLWVYSFTSAILICWNNDIKKLSFLL
jgi:hypothetical protein